MLYSTHNLSVVIRQSLQIMNNSIKVNGKVIGKSAV